MIDIHNHILINVDDGPQTKEDTLKMLNQAIEQGITSIIATPHHYSGNWITPRDIVETKLQEVQGIINEYDLNIKVYPGQEIRVNGEILEELESNVNMSLNDSKYLLIEFPFNDLPYYVDTLFYNVELQGYIPIIAHPERCKPIIQNPDLLYKLVTSGATSQVTATAVTGDLGDNLQRTSLEMLKNNLAHFVASDAHDIEVRPFKLKEAYDIIEKELGTETVNRLKYNAEAVLNNKEIKVLPPTEMKTHYQKKKKKKWFGLF